MSYCVNCGVELDGTAEFCPLCRTPVYNPSQPVDLDRPAPFPADPGEVAPVSMRGLAVLISATLASVAACCGLLNLFLQTRHIWSLYVIGAAAMLWVFLVPPLLWRKRPLPTAVVLDTGAVGLYLLLIAWELGGFDWYFGLALPIVVLLGLIVLGLAALLQGGRHSILFTIVLIVASVGLFIAGLVLLCGLYLNGVWRTSRWMIPLIVTAALEIPLLVVYRVPGLRREARRRFHM